MTRDEIIELRQKLLLGVPPYETGAMGELMRKGGIAGLDERRRLGAYDANASGLLLVMETSLMLCNHALDNMPRGKDE